MKHFNLEHFKKWMSEQNDKPQRISPLVGLQVESKVSVKGLLKRLTAEEGEAKELAKDFRKHGGVILDEDRDHNLLIEVDSGTFKINRYFVKKS